MEVPKEVITAAKSLVELYGQNFEFLGNKDGKDVYAFVFPDGVPSGFPFVFLHENGKPVRKVTGYDALDIVCSFDVK